MQQRAGSTTLEKEETNAKQASETTKDGELWERLCDEADNAEDRRQRGMAAIRKKRELTKIEIIVETAEDFKKLYANFTKLAGGSSSLEEALVEMDGLSQRCLWQCPRELEIIGKEAMMSCRQDVLSRLHRQSDT